MAETQHERAEQRKAEQEARVTAHINKLVSEAPPLTQEQKDRLHVLLRPNG